MITPALAALLALGLQEVGLHFAPEEGLALSKTVLVRHELGLIEMGSTREGSPLLREDVGGWLVEQGWALAFRRYGKQYVPVEARARAARRGLWSGSFVPPWAWRKGNAGEVSAALGAAEHPRAHAPVTSRCTAAV